MEKSRFGLPRSEALPLLKIIYEIMKQKKIDYKDVAYLHRFITEQGKILSRRFTGLKAKEQRELTKAVKQARILGLLGFGPSTKTR